MDYIASSRPVKDTGGPCLKRLKNLLELWFLPTKRLRVIRQHLEPIAEISVLLSHPLNVSPNVFKKMT